MIRFILSAFFLSLAAPAFAADATTPNIILIVADDLGCFEVGAYGQTKIKTPNIDALAKNGMKFNRFYSGNAVCAPSRCCLMTGKHPGHATIRDNREAKPEGQHPIQATDVTIPDVLKAKGYTTGAIGKWGLGMFESTGDPFKHGVDFFFGYNCQRHAHYHYPKYLYRTSPQKTAEKFDLPGNDLKTGDTYSHDLFEKETLNFIRTNEAKPFFLFLPFIIPHVSLQVPEAELNAYKGTLGDDPAYDGKKGYIPHPAPHAGYAAMVTRLDKTVGKIVEELKARKLSERTLIMFTSDNGPTHNVGGADSTFFESAGKLKGLKGSLYEGGIRVPMIASWPGVIKPGTTDDTPFAFWDMMPTLAEIAGAKAPSGDGISFWPVLAGAGPAKARSHLYWEFPGYGGQQAVLAGEWKAVRQKMAQLKGKPIVTELYHIATDPNESTDVAAKNPDIVKKLEAIMVAEHTPSGLFPLPAVDGVKK